MVTLNRPFQEVDVTPVCIYFFQETEEIEDMIADGLSQLGRSADGTLQVYLNLFLAVLRFCSC